MKADLHVTTRKIETSRRREVLSFSHHAEVAALEPPDQKPLARCDRFSDARGAWHPRRSSGPSVRRVCCWPRWRNTHQGAIRHSLRPIPRPGWHGYGEEEEEEMK